MTSYALGALLLAVGLTDPSAAMQIDSHSYFVPQLSAGQTYSNVFSILRSTSAPGYDDHVTRNGGSADYRVTSISPNEWQFQSSWSYDGQQHGQDEEALRDLGRTSCSMSNHSVTKCQPYLEASGLLYNPALWGTAPSRISSGTSWKVDLKTPWELGGSDGTQTVTVVRVDPASQSATLMREGDSVGAYSESDPPSVELTRGGIKESFTVIPGATHWKGYTTFVKGVVISDELLVTRKDVLRGKDGKNIEATERRIMLLNAAPYPTL